jgi:hypothetical protein
MENPSSGSDGLQEVMGVALPAFLRDAAHSHEEARNSIY